MGLEHIIFTHARMGNLEGVRECLEKEPSLLNTTSALSSKTLLNLAIENGHYALSRALLGDFGALLDEQCLYLAVHEARDIFGFPICRQFTRAIRCEMVQLMLHYDPNFLHCNADKALICAVEQNFRSIVKLLLEHGGVNPNKCDEHGRSALHILFEDEDPRDVKDALKMIKLLCKHGASLNAQQPSLVLHQAIMVRGYEELVFYMVAKGADIYQIDERNSNKNAMDIASENRTDNPELPALLERAWLSRSDDTGATSSSYNDDDDDDDDDIHEEFRDHEDDTDDVIGAELCVMDESQVENSLKTLPDAVKSMYGFIDEDVEKMKYSVKRRLYQLIMSGGQQGESFGEEDYHYDYNGSMEREDMEDVEEEEDEEEAERALEARLAWLKKMEGDTQ